MAKNNVLLYNSIKVKTRFDLVNFLLSCPQNVNDILRDNPEIVDYGLVQLLETMSKHMIKNHRQGAANFLKDIADVIQWQLSVNKVKTSV